MLNNVWTYDELKTPIRVYLTETQKEQVLKQYEQSFPEKEARKEFEEYPELYTKLFIANERMIMIECLSQCPAFSEKDGKWNNLI